MQSIYATLTAAINDADRIHCGPARNGLWQNDPNGRIFWLVDGEGVATFYEKTYRLRPGPLFLLPARTAIVYEHERMDIYWIHFTAHVLGTLDPFAILGCEYEVAVPDPALVQAVEDQLLQAWKQQSLAGKVAAEGYLRTLIARFLATADPRALEERQQEIARFREVFTYIEQHLDTRLTLTELADIVYLHPTYFANVFSRCIGEGPLAYVNRRRIERAQALLWQDDATLDDIARRVGFHDPFYFSRVFKKFTGYAPSVFRERRNAMRL